MNIRKIQLIFKREYFTRVRNKTFIISTILTPLSIIAIMMASAYLSSGVLNKQQKLLVLDKSGLFKEELNNSTKNTYIFGNPNDLNALNNYSELGFDAVIEIPDFDRDTVVATLPIAYTSPTKPGISLLTTFESKFANILRRSNMLAAGYDPHLISKLKPEISIVTTVSKSENIPNGSAAGKEQIGEEINEFAITVGSGIGGAMGFLMYMVLIIYGSFVMRSVMEEKINRIVEVIISSVKPFELMLGKILGVGAVGLTQLVIWIVLIGVGNLIIGSFFAHSGTLEMDQISKMASEIEAGNTGLELTNVMHELAKINWLIILPAFLLFFLSGFLMYASTFAAVGSAIGDDMNEGNSLSVVIMMPIIISMLLLFPALNDPHGTAAVVSSIFPLTAPIIMPARLAFDPPLWQLVLSLFSVILGAIFFIWLSGKIYKAGILLYGKKLSFKNLWHIIKT